ncbi:MAG: DUF2158 domain-containing protein [Rhodovulum sp.]|nr:DUF2158 domain-containing protein [Rhodovulum sp.]
MPRKPDRQSADDFSPGDVVGLRSGGPKMTVETVTPEGVICTWWCPKTGDMCAATFMSATLERDAEP